MTGKIKTIAKIIRLIAIIWRVLLCCNKGTRKLAPKLDAIKAGNVPKPKNNIKSAPFIALPDAIDHVSAV
jgi:hypothetical protein